MSKDKTRKFDTGAIRDTDEDKPDYEGYLSPLVIERFGQYMLKHQTDAADKQRASDNWQRGIPKEAYIKSMWRHFHEVWKLHRSGEPGIDEALCALLFNVQGHLHEHLKDVETLADNSFIGVEQGTDIHIKHETGEIQIDLTDAPPFFELPNGVRYTQEDGTS